MDNSFNLHVDTRSEGQPTRYLADEERCESFIIPKLTDMFIAYSTMPGYVSHAAGEHGSIYIQALAKCLKQRYKTDDFGSIHMMVKRVMAEAVQDDGTKQGAEERNSLLRKLKFTEKVGYSNQFLRCSFSTVWLQFAFPLQA